jgi:hypothetical protein
MLCHAALPSILPHYYYIIITLQYAIYVIPDTFWLTILPLMPLFRHAYVDGADVSTGLLPNTTSLFSSL